MVSHKCITSDRNGSRTSGTKCGSPGMSGTRSGEDLEATEGFREGFNSRKMPVTLRVIV